MQDISKKERVMIGADLNSHVGAGNREDEEVMGRYGVKKKKNDK